ncbi:MAG: hypothetical protein JSV60_01680, partial [Desulfobacterales bacterium]
LRPTLVTLFMDGHQWALRKNRQLTDRPYAPKRTPTVSVLFKRQVLAFLYAHLCASLSRLGIGLPVCGGAFKYLNFYP